MFEIDLIGETHLAPKAGKALNSGFQQALLRSDKEIQQAFDLVGNNRRQDDNLRLFSNGALVSKDDFPQSFIVTLHSGSLDSWDPLDLARISIHGTMVLSDSWTNRRRQNGGPIKSLSIAYNAETKAYRVSTNSGTVLAEGTIPNEGSPSLRIADAGSPSYGSNISSVEVKNSIT